MLDLLADKVLKDGTFACALTTDNGDLRQVELHSDPELSERILELVDDRDELLHSDVAGHGCGDPWLGRLELF